MACYILFLLCIDPGILNIIMGTPLLFPALFVFLRLLAILAHARTLSDNSVNAFRQTDNLEMPTSLSPPCQAAREISPDSSSCNRLMRITQMEWERPPEPPPPAPISPSGPDHSPRPASPAECLSSWFIPITTSTSPCYGKGSSSLASSSLAHGKTSDFNYHSTTAQGLFDHFRNRMDSRRSSVPLPPPKTPIPNIAVASSPKSPSSTSLASY